MRSPRTFAPPWIFRHLPQGNSWQLLYKYRRGHFDTMLRKYLHDWRLEQLAVPCLSVTLDLVSGNSVVRERGDAVHAILESINLPVLSVPIVRNGQALIDGGLVNNIPADVLVSMGCNFVIAVSVTSKLETRFCDISPEGPHSVQEQAGPRTDALAQPARSKLQPERLRCSTGGRDYRAGRDGHRSLGIHEGEGTRRDRRGGPRSDKSRRFGGCWIGSILNYSSQAPTHVSTRRRDRHDSAMAPRRALAQPRSKHTLPVQGDVSLVPQASA